MTNDKFNDLIIKIAKGDNEAFAQFYEQTVKGVFVFAYSYLKEKLS